MVTKDLIAAIELNSLKIKGIAGKKGDEGKLEIKAYAEEESNSFIRRGVIYNIDKMAISLKSIVNNLEKQLECKISKVYIGTCGQSVVSSLNTISSKFEEEHIIEENDINEMFQQNSSHPYEKKEILTIIPQEYKIGNNYYSDPIGVASDNLSGGYLNILANKNLKKNLERSFQKAEIEKAELLISPLTTANLVLDENERRGGCILVDFGYETTTISIYKNNILRYLSVLPLGSNHITKDLTCLQIEVEEAEQIKLDFSDRNLESLESSEEKAILYKLKDEREIDEKVIIDIIEARLLEIAKNINQLIINSKCTHLLSGIILTGGGSNLSLFTEILRKETSISKIKKSPALVSQINQSRHFFDFKDTGTQNSILALLSAGEVNCCTQPEEIKPLFTNEDIPTVKEEVEKEIEETKEKSIEKEKTEQKPQTKEKKGKTHKNQSNLFKSIKEKMGTFTSSLFDDEDDMDK